MNDACRGVSFALGAGLQPAACFSLSSGSSTCFTPSRHRLPHRNIPCTVLQRTFPKCGIAPRTILVGDVVAISRNEGVNVNIGRVTSVYSSGETVDIEPLREFVRELYVSGDETSYERVEHIRKVESVFVSSQNGWIVLDVDVEKARGEFRAEKKETQQKSEVVVKEAPRKQLSEEALKRQFFPRPTKGQALTGAALSVPVAAVAYAYFVKARELFAGDTIQDGLKDVFAVRTALLLGSAAAVLGSLVVGCALFLYAVGGEADRRHL